MATASKVIKRFPKTEFSTSSYFQTRRTNDAVKSRSCPATPGEVRVVNSTPPHETTIAASIERIPFSTIPNRQRDGHTVSQGHFTAILWSSQNGIAIDTSLKPSGNWRDTKDMRCISIDPACYSSRYRCSITLSRYTYEKNKILYRTDNTTWYQIAKMTIDRPSTITRQIVAWYHVKLQGI